MRQAEGWRPTAPDGLLDDGEVCVWLGSLDAHEEEPDPSTAILSADEEYRAARFVFAQDRRRFIAARVLLRRLLGSYLEMEPADLRFAYDQYGKPSATGCPSAPAFNVSHSQGVAVIAVSRAGDVGVDIEALRPIPRAQNIAARFFAPSEIEALLSLPSSARERAFFDCWTRKEAFIKAVGQGLSYPLHSFAVTLRPDEPALIVQSGTAYPPGSVHWTLEELPRVAGYAGALAVRGRPRAIHYCAWTDTRGETSPAIHVP